VFSFVAICRLAAHCLDMQIEQMSYLTKLKLAGYSFVGLSADWANAAYRIDGNEHTGAVVFEGDNGELEHITYTHNEDGERTDVVVSRVPDITPELLSAYLVRVACAETRTGGHDPVGCFERAAGALGLGIWMDDEHEHAGGLLADVAGWIASLS
jgi:hypothetical protein